MPPGGFSYVLLSRKALTVLLSNQEAHPFFQGQILWSGFEPKIIEFVRPAREKGRSRWTMGKRITLLIDGFLSYSYLPIRLMSLMGVIAAISGMLLAMFILTRKIFIGTVVAGWAGLMIVTLIMGGIQMLMLGILGEYLWRTLAQARRREEYVIDTVYDMTRPTSVE
jgi:dolichol-phosphate mannosyltransferase